MAKAVPAQSFAYLSGVLEGQDILNSLLRNRALQPGLILALDEGALALDRKLDAMRCYRSELRPYPHPRSLHSLRERAGMWGSVANMTAAEPLMLLRARE